MAVVFFAGAFLAVVAFFADAFFAVVAFFAGAFLAGAAFLAVVVAFFAGAFLAVVAFFAGAVFLAGAFAVVVVFFAGAAFLAGAFLAVLVAVAFRAPETNALKSEAGRNFGTFVAFTLTVWPVLGLRAVRAPRAMFSKMPKPAIWTFSPFVTAPLISSTTASTISVASLRLFSSRSARLSISSALFTRNPFVVGGTSPYARTSARYVSPHPGHRWWRHAEKPTVALPA